MTQMVRSESLRGYTQFVTEMSGDAEALLKRQGLDLKSIETGNELIPYRSFVALLEDSAVTLNCLDFGLRLSMRQDFSILGPIALAAQQGNNLREAMARVVDYIHSYSSAIVIKMHEFPDDPQVLFTFEVDLKPYPVCRQAIELSMGLALQVFLLLSQGKGRPNQVNFPHSKIVSSRLYRLIFACPVKFQQGIASFSINKESLDLPVKPMEGALGKLAYEYLQNQFTAEQKTMGQKVSALIRPLLMVGQCSNEMVAQTLEMNTRAMHRALRQEKTSFIKIKNEVRKELAIQYLQQDSFSMGQITALLGFSEQSAFSRNCQGWFNVGPREYRKKLLAD